MQSVILGTRGSALALAQTTLVTQALEAAHPGLSVSHRTIQTTGDLRQDIRLGGGTPGFDKAVWTKELESALADGSVQAAVHSGKDVPTELPPGFALIGCLPRAAAPDVLISKHPGGLHGLPDGAVVATSSVRRQRQLQWLRRDVRTVEMRGNVPTRLRKLQEDATLDALLLARAGLDRLAIEPPDGLFFHELPATEFLPAAAQGIVVIEALEEAQDVAEIFGAITHGPTWTVLRAEREFLRLLGAGCSTPVGVRTWQEGGRLRMEGCVFDEGISPPRCGEASGSPDDPEGCASELCRALDRER